MSASGVSSVFSLVEQFGSIIQVIMAGILYIAMTKKVSPVLLFKKVLPTFIIAFSSASSIAAFSRNTQDSVSKLGIDKKLVEFATPLGQVLFMPGVMALLYGSEICFAELYGINITVPWLIIALITNVLLSISVPPVPGCMMMIYTIAFAQLGIPLEVMGIVLAVDIIMDFPCTAIDVSSWQLSLINIADSLDMLDQEVLHKV